MFCFPALLKNEYINNHRWDTLKREIFHFFLAYSGSTTKCFHILLQQCATAVFCLWQMSVIELKLPPRKLVLANHSGNQGFLWICWKYDWNWEQLSFTVFGDMIKYLSLQFPILPTPPADQVKRMNSNKADATVLLALICVWFSSSKVLNLYLNHQFCFVFFSLFPSLANIQWRWVIGVPWENFLTRFKLILLQEEKCGCLSSLFSESCYWGQQSSLLGEMNSLLFGAILNSLVVRTSAMTSPSPSPTCVSGFCRSYLCLYQPSCTWRTCSTWWGKKRSWTKERKSSRWSRMMVWMWICTSNK